MSSYNWTYYHDNGRLASEGSISHGIPEGTLHRGWFDNGNMSYEFELLNGVNHGRFRTFYENGKPRIEGHFNQGQPDGYWSLWNNKGIRMIRGEFTADGLFRILEARDVFRQQIIADGTGNLDFMMHQSYISDRKASPVVRVTLNYEDGFKSGERTETRPDGAAVQVSEFSNGRYNGKWIVNYPNGMPRVEMSYTNGIPSGRSLEKNEAGKTILTKQFPVVKADSFPDPLALPRPNQFDILWEAKVASELYPGMAGLDIDPFLSALLEAVRTNSLHAYMGLGLSKGFESRLVKGNAIIDTLSVNNRGPIVNTYAFSKEDISGYLLYESWYYDRQYDRLIIEPVSLGFQYGEGDTAIFPVWFDVQELGSSGDTAIASMVHRIRTRSLPSSLPFVVDQSLGDIYHDPATLTYHAELEWVRLNTYWMDLLSGQLNLSGIDRKAP